MEQHIPQEEVRRIIISDMVKKRNTIVPVIGEDTMVYSLCIPSIHLWLSYGALKWIRSAFKEGSRAMRSDTLLIEINALAHEACLATSRNRKAMG